MNNRSLTDIRAVTTGALGLIGLYSVVCSVPFNSAEEMNETGGVNANLWSGLGLLATTAGTGLRWWIKPNPSGGEQGGDWLSRTGPVPVKSPAHRVPLD